MIFTKRNIKLSTGKGKINNYDTDKFLKLFWQRKLTSDFYKTRETEI